MLNFEEFADSLYRYVLQLFDNVTIGYIPTDTHLKLNTKDVLESSERFLGRYTRKSLFFITFQAVRRQVYEKRDSSTYFFLWNFQNSPEHLFIEYFRVVTSDYEAYFEKIRYQLHCSGNFSYHFVVDWKLFLDQIKPTATFEILRLALKFQKFASKFVCVTT